MNTCYEVPIKPIQLFHVKKFVPFSVLFPYGFFLPACLYSGTSITFMSRNMSSFGFIQMAIITSRLILS